MIIQVSNCCKAPWTRTALSSRESLVCNACNNSCSLTTIMYTFTSEPHDILLGNTFSLNDKAPPKDGSWIVGIWDNDLYLARWKQVGQMHWVGSTGESHIFDPIHWATITVLKKGSLGEALQFIENEDEDGSCIIHDEGDEPTDDEYYSNEDDYSSEDDDN